MRRRSPVDAEQRGRKEAGGRRRRVVHDRLRHGLGRARPTGHLALAESRVSVSWPGPAAKIAARRCALQR
ncbi:hypothetical protein ACFVGM_09685 [Kitasatospora purpeofusca]|uniref:hypothetical protein n=1 Tax=Kitasatospora purpeofusca TaxID=67352 RepID=UPI0036C8A47D